MIGGKFLERRVLKYMENRPEGEVPSATIRSLRDIHHSPSTDDKMKLSSH